MIKIHTIYDESFHFEKNKRKDIQYRFKKRTKMVLNILSKYNPLKIIDIGTADGESLKIIKRNLPDSQVIGTDYNNKLLKYSLYKGISCDAECLPFKNNSINALMLTAVIEHLKNPENFVKEAKRVLKKERLIILTTPVPFFESIAKKIKYLKNDIHYECYNFKKLSELFNDFKIIEKRKFMVTPFGFPFEDFFEDILNFLGIDFFMLNQLFAVIKK